MTDPRAKLTDRELEVLICSARYGMAAAAEELGIREQSVKNCLVNIYRKLEARSMAHAILILSEKP